MTAPISSRHTRQHPRGQLPVAAYPAMASRDVRAVTRGKLLVQLHVAEQACPCVTTFQKVVAEDPVLRQTPRECMLECIDVVDAFADKRSFAEQILVDVGNNSRIRVDARLAAEKSRV